MAARGQPYSYEYRMIAADGRTVWIRESGMVLMEKGQAVAMRGIFQDITQHKLDAAELDKLNRQLMEPHARPAWPKWPPACCTTSATYSTV